MTPEQRAERQKQMKTELVAKAKITEAEADKVMQIQQESRAGLRGLRDMSPEDRQKKLDEVKAENTLHMQKKAAITKLIRACSAAACWPRSAAEAALLRYCSQVACGNSGATRASRRPVSGSSGVTR